MIPPRLFLTRPIPEEGFRILDRSEIEVRRGETLPERPVDEEVLEAGFRNADGVLCLLTETVDRELLAANPGLRGVANMAVGYDNIDVEAATELGIPVSNTPGILTHTTADLAMALLLAVARKIPRADRYLRQGRYRSWDPELFVGRDVGPGGDGRSRTLGVVGFGRIGQAVTRRAAGFELEVLANDPRHRDRVERDSRARWAELDELLAESDFVTLHVPLNEQTRHLIGAPELRRMRTDGYLINTSRGPVIDEGALVEALREGRIAGAGLDVYEDEPRVSRGLLELDDVVLLPHIGSASRSTRDGMATAAAENALAHIRGDPAPNCVNPEVYGTERYRRRVEARSLLEWDE